MSLFDSLLGQLAGQVTGAIAPGAGTTQGGLMGAVMQLLTDPQHGGLQGLIAQFEQHGLSQVAASWVGTGQNLPVSGEQIAAVLGNGKLVAMAQQLGLDPQALGGQLAQLLPQVVDHLTPLGEVPAADALQSGLQAGLLPGGALGSLLGQFLSPR